MEKKEKKLWGKTRISFPEKKTEKIPGNSSQFFFEYKQKNTFLSIWKNLLLK